jgi:hypothetical protein
MSIDNQPIFSASTDANPNAGWNNPYAAPDGVLTRAGGEQEALGQEGSLNDRREINADTVPTYDNIVHGQFNRKIHLPYHQLVALVSRFHLSPSPPPPWMKRHNSTVESSKGTASATNGGKSAASAAAFAAALKAAKQSYWFKQLEREKAKAAAIEAAKMRAYRRLWQEQGRDYSASPRGSKVTNPCRHVVLLVVPSHFQFQTQT